MKHISIFLLSFSLLFSSCNSDDDSNNNTITINGTWSLKNVSGGLAGVDEDIGIGVIKWIFNENTSILTIENNSIGTFSGFPSGNYNYSLETNNGIEYITINNFEMVITSLLENEMIIDEGIAVDGFLYKFNR